MTLTFEYHDPRIEGRGQTMDYTEIVDAERQLAGVRRTYKLRVHIHLDTHAEQAYASVACWSGTRWESVVDMRGDALTTDLHLGYKSGLTEEDKWAAFHADVTRLLALAKEVFE